VNRSLLQPSDWGGLEEDWFFVVRREMLLTLPAVKYDVLDVDVYARLVDGKAGTLFGANSTLV